jgi:protein O-mannosyl-transferase
VLPLLVAAVTCIAFWPALDNDFVDWDDITNFLENPSYRGLGWGELRWMWTTRLLGHYVPMSWMTLGLDYLLWGMNPRGYHLTNVLLHVTNALIFYFVALRLLTITATEREDSAARRLGAGFAALVFAVHPLRVESVAWITERRDVLSGLFYLLTILGYLRYAEAEGSERARRWYWISLGCFVLALLSKAITVTLPIVLLVLDVYPLRRLDRDAGWSSPPARRRWIDKVPFVLASAAVAPITFMAALGGGNIGSLTTLGPLERLAVCLYGLAFYLRKLVLPLDLVPVYELRFPILPLSAPYLLSAALVAAITGLALGLRKRWPALGAAWLAYVFTLLPVAGLFQNGIQIVADRYSYLPSLPLAILAGAGAMRLLGEAARRRRRVATGLLVTTAGLAVVSVLAALTWKQVGLWRDSQRLWAHAVVTAPSSMAHYNFANLLARQSRWVEANEHYRAAASIRPDWENVQVNWGVALARQGRVDEAISRYREAIRTTPHAAPAHYNWANAIVATDPQGAIHHYGEAVRIDPRLAEAYNNWGMVLAQQDKWEEAVDKFRAAVRIRPDYARASANLEAALVQIRKSSGRAP